MVGKGTTPEKIYEATPGGRGHVDTAKTKQ